ncbi:MAG: guanylate kinase [Magnetococcales bacterium]|nr:guanylate kinase [Magnetococcales bacterium]
MRQTTRRGMVIIVSAPSGAGKTTLTRHLMQHVPGVVFSVSTTTRDQRPGERAGVDYHYVTRESFLEQVEQGAFLEWAEVFGNYYGTTRRAVEEVLLRGEDVLLDIDWQGARHIRAHLDEADVASIFILPPSREVLTERLVNRAREGQAEIDRRLGEARRDIGRAEEYDYLVINDRVEEAGEALVAIVRAERLKRHRQMDRVAGILSTFQG